MVMRRVFKGLILSTTLLLTFLAYAATAPLTIIPNPERPNFLLNPNPGYAIVEYFVTNQSSTKINTFNMMPNGGVFQNTNEYGQCGNVHSLYPKASCMLSLTVDRSQLSQINGGPLLCPFNSSTMRGCVQPRPEHALTVQTLPPTFPYGIPPVGNVCVTTADLFATPESMLGSWAMIEAVNIDKTGGVLPPFLSASNLVYGVGTAAIGNLLGVPNCAGGCNQLNGFCFALKFNTKPSFPYMIFQSVNIAAATNTFDIYMAGGGSGAFPQFCSQFWGTGNSVDWSANIENSSCSAYFHDFATINSQYFPTPDRTMHPAKQTLIDACNYASAGQSGFNTQNWPNVSIVPVTCPTSLTQITGLALPASITMVGNQPIHNLSTLTDADFTSTTIPQASTTQMQDCKTPSSGFCGNVAAGAPNYQASISASLTKPLLTGNTPSGTYCQTHPGQQFCSWSTPFGSTSGSDYCNQGGATRCLGGCGNNNPVNHAWCTCDAQGNLITPCATSSLG